MVVVVVWAGGFAFAFQVVVVCFCNTPGAGSVTVCFCTTAPLSQVVVVVCEPAAGGIALVVCEFCAGATGGLIWTTGGVVVCTSLVVRETHPSITRATEPKMASGGSEKILPLSICPPETRLKDLPSAPDRWCVDKQAPGPDRATGVEHPVSDA